jgi:hypothetical protein
LYFRRESYSTREQLRVTVFQSLDRFHAAQILSVIAAANDQERIEHHLIERLTDAARRAGEFAIEAAVAASSTMPALVDELLDFAKEHAFAKPDLLERLWRHESLRNRLDMNYKMAAVRMATATRHPGLLHQMLVHEESIVLGPTTISTAVSVAYERRHDPLIKKLLSSGVDDGHRRELLEALADNPADPETVAYKRELKRTLREERRQERRYRAITAAEGRKELVRTLQPLPSVQRLRELVPLDVPVWRLPPGWALAHRHRAGVSRSRYRPCVDVTLSAHRARAVARIEKTSGQAAPLKASDKALLRLLSVSSHRRRWSRGF